MKRKLLLLAVMGMLACSYANAQIRKGSVLLGGSVGYYRSESKQINFPNPTYSIVNKSFFVSPSLGIAIRDNLVLGGDLTYQNSKEKYDNPTMQSGKSDGYGAGVFLRKYWQVADKLYLFGDGRLGYNYSNSHASTSTPLPVSVVKEHRIGLSFFPGVSFAVSKKVHLESKFLNLLTIEYVNSNVRDKSSGRKTSSGSSFDFSSSFSNATAFSVGVKLLLSK